MSELPTGWAKTTLQELTAPRGDKAAPSDLDDIPFIGMDHIEAHTSRLLATQSVKELKSAVAIFRAGDILYGRLRPYLNKVHEAQFDGAASAEFIVIPPSPVIEQRYLAHLMRTPSFIALANQRSTGDRPRVTFESVGDFPIQLPPITEQRRIVAKLDQLFERTTLAREELARIPTLVEHYKQAVLRKAFSGGLTVVERERHGWNGQHLSADNIDHRSHDLLEVLPEGWSWSSMDQVTDVSGGLTKNAARTEQTEQVPYLRVANVYANELRLDEIKTIGCSSAELKKTALEKDDLLIVEGNGSIDQIGRVAIWDDSIPSCSHQNHLIRARSKKIVPAKFLLYWLLSPVGRQAIERVASSSAGLHTLSITKVSGIPLPIPSHAEAERIVCLIEEAFDWIERVSRERDKATTLLDHLDNGLLGKAFRGELVPQDPADEPAARLLERIQAERGAQAPARRGRRASARA